MAYSPQLGYRYGGSGSDDGTPTKTISQLENEAKKRTEAQEKEIRGLLDQIIQMYQPGGSFGKGTEAMLTRQKEKDLASATQSLVSSGLFGTTMAAGLPKKWEEEVGMPSRLKLEDVRYGALSEALGQKASFVQSIENAYPDYGMIAQLQSKANSGASMPFYGGYSGSGSIAPTGGTTQSMLDAQKQQQWIDEYNAKSSKAGGISLAKKGTTYVNNKLVY